MFLWRSAPEAPLCSDSPRPSWPNKTPRAPVMTGPRDTPPPRCGEATEPAYIPACSHESLFPTASVYTFSDVSLGSGWKPLGLESLRSRLSESKLGDGFPCLTSACQWQKWRGAGLWRPGQVGAWGGVRGDVRGSRQLRQHLPKLQESQGSG